MKRTQFRRWPFLPVIPGFLFFRRSGPELVTAAPRYHNIFRICRPNLTSATESPEGKLQSRYSDNGFYASDSTRSGAKRGGGGPSWRREGTLEGSVERPGEPESFMKSVHVVSRRVWSSIPEQSLLRANLLSCILRWIVFTS